jgi:hypothetical protein
MPVSNCGQDTGRHERERRKKANVPFDLSFALCDLGERPNAPVRKIVNPSACLGNSEKDGVASFCSKCWPFIRLMQHTLHGFESVSLPWRAYWRA